MSIGTPAFEIATNFGLRSALRETRTGMRDVVGQRRTNRKKMNPEEGEEGENDFFLKKIISDVPLW